MLNRRSIARLLMLVAFGTATAAAPDRASRADEKPKPATPKSSAIGLLELGNHYSPAALAKVREYHEALPERVADDPRVRYAWGLVLIRQHCHQEAFVVLEALVSEQPQALHFRRAKIWTQLVLHKEREALTEVRAVAELLGKTPVADLPVAEAEEWRTTAGFLGRVFGFIEGVRANVLSGDTVRRAKQAVLVKLGDERAEFSENEQACAEKFGQARAAAEELRAKRTAERTNKQKEYGKQKKAIDEAETHLDFSSEKVKAETKTAVGQIDSSVESLQKAIAACQFRMNDVQLAIQAVEIRLAKLSGDLPGSPDIGTIAAGPGGKKFAEGQLNAELLQLSATQYTLQQQLIELNRQMQAAMVQREHSLGKAGQASEELKMKAAMLKREEKKLERSEQTEAKHVATERSKNLLTSQKSFTSFEPFPFDHEKLRVLGKAAP